MADKKKYLPDVEPIEIFPGMGIKGAGGKLPAQAVKHTKIRKEYASLKKAQHLRTKLEKAKEIRIKEAKVSEFKKKYIEPASSEIKIAISKQKAPKSWKRQELKKEYASLRTKPGYTD